MKRAVFFDLDGTLIKGQSQKIMLLHLWQKQRISFFTLLIILIWFLLYSLNLALSVPWIMVKVYRRLRGMKEEEFNDLLEKVVADEVEKKLFPEALKKIRIYQKEGYKVGIISTSLSSLVKILAEKLDLDFALGTKLETKNGVFTGRIEGRVLYGKEKARVAKSLASKEGWDLSQSYAFTDSFSDIPLLKLVGYPVVVNPDRKLRKKASLLNWPIRHWFLL